MSQGYIFYLQLSPEDNNRGNTTKNNFRHHPNCFCILNSVLVIWQINRKDFITKMYKTIYNIQSEKSRAFFNMIVLQYIIFT